MMCRRLSRFLGGARAPVKVIVGALHMEESLSLERQGRYHIYCNTRIAEDIEDQDVWGRSVGDTHASR